MERIEETRVLLPRNKISQEFFLSLINKLLPALLLLALVSLLYLSTIHLYYTYDASHVPTGDPFTYTITWFRAITEAHQHYIKKLFKALLGKSDWYQLQYLLVTLFSPMLTLNPTRICIINFFSFFVATFFWYRLALIAISNRYLALACSLLYWFFPAHYGIFYPIALFNLQLDTMFFNIFGAAVASMLIYSIKPNRSHAVVAGIMISLAIWGRPNSLPYVLIGLFVPSIYLLKTYLTYKDSQLAKKSLINTSILTFIVLLFSFLFYKHHLKEILIYYTPHYHILHSSNFINWVNILKNAKNIPSVFFKFNSNSSLAIIFTILVHLFMVATTLIIFIKPLQLTFEQRILKIICLTGLFIFYGTLISIAFIFNANSFMLWQPYVPTLAGLYLVLLAITLYFLFSKKALFKSKIVSKFTFVLIIIIAPIYGYVLSSKQMATTAATNTPTPQQIIFLATHMEHIFGNSSIAFLWYNTYNEPIINYYRAIYGLSAIPTGGKQGLRFYNNSYWPDIWEPTVQVNQQRLKKGLQETVAQADYVVVPDCISTPNPVIPYNPNQFYPLYLNKNLITEVFNLPSTAHFKVKMILHEAEGVRLLVLQRLNKNSLPLRVSDLLPKPFPQYPRCRKLTYGHAVN